MDINKFYLIVGVFFHEKNTPYFDYSTGEAQAAMRTVTEYAMFHGGLDTYTNQGLLNDKYGDSEIEICDLYDNKLSFVKKYSKSNRPKILYEFFHDPEKINQQVDHWTGTWKSGKIGGIARMVTVPVNQTEFFNYTSVITELKAFLPEDKIPIKIVEEPESKPHIEDLFGKPPSSDDGEDLPF